MSYKETLRALNNGRKKLMTVLQSQTLQSNVHLTSRIFNAGKCDSMCCSERIMYQPVRDSWTAVQWVGGCIDNDM